MRRSNIEASIPHGLVQLEASGALGNFRNAAAGSGTYRGGSDDSGRHVPVPRHGRLQVARGGRLGVGRGRSVATPRSAEPAVEAVVAPSGRMAIWGPTSSSATGEPYRDLQWGHELYNIGHLLQAAIAWQRVLGDDRLLRTATRAVDHVADAMGPGRRDAVDGHPEIEMALVELFRETGEERHLALARHLIDQRGHGLLGAGRFGRAYWQDHLPVREAPTVAGHAVRQMYLDCGAVDVATETGDQALLDAVLRRWTDMTATRTYLTGALGSRHQRGGVRRPVRAAARPCLRGDLRRHRERHARLAAAARDRRDALRRRHRASAPQRRPLRPLRGWSGVLLCQPAAGADGRHGLSGRCRPCRAPWYACACCPPNLMRLIASVDQMAAASRGAELLVSQFLGGELRASLAVGEVALRITTDQPWEGAVSWRSCRRPTWRWYAGHPGAGLGDGGERGPLRRRRHDTARSR